jgi:energy-coupling factor transport system permease protein
MTFTGSIALGQYIPAGSAVHRLDPRCKIIMVVVSMAGIFMCRTFPALLLWAALLPLLIYMSKLPAAPVLRSVRPVFMLIIFTSLFHLFFTPGINVFKLYFITVSREGIEAAVQFGLRLALMVIYAAMLTLTTSPSELSDGLETIMSPLKRIGVPAHETAMMVTLALRFIPTLFEETNRLLKAQASRGADFESGGLIHRAKEYIPVLIPLFVLVFQRADTLASAMESRGYRGGAGRVRMYPLEWKTTDTLFFMSFVLFLALTIAVNRMAA